MRRPDVFGPPGRDDERHRRSPRRRPAPVGAYQWTTHFGHASVDVSPTFDIVEQVIRATLTGEYPFLDADDVTPSLRAALVALDKATRERAYDLVNELGEKNFTQFNNLLPKRGASTE